MLKNKSLFSLLEITVTLIQKSIISFCPNGINHFDKEVIFFKEFLIIKVFLSFFVLEPVGIDFLFFSWVTIMRFSHFKLVNINYLFCLKFFSWLSCLEKLCVTIFRKIIIKFALDNVFLYSFFLCSIMWKYPSVVIPPKKRPYLLCPFLDFSLEGQANTFFFCYIIQNALWH